MEPGLPLENIFVAQIKILAAAKRPSEAHKFTLIFRRC